MLCYHGLFVKNQAGEDFLGYCEINQLSSFNDEYMLAEEGTTL